MIKMSHISGKMRLCAHYTDPEPVNLIKVVPFLAACVVST